MGTENCCCSCMGGEKNLEEERANEVFLKPKEGKKFQLLCLKGHEIVFFKTVKQNYEETLPGDSHPYVSSRESRSAAKVSSRPYSIGLASETEQGVPLVCRRCS